MLPETACQSRWHGLVQCLSFCGAEGSGFNSKKRDGRIEIGTQYGPFDEVQKTGLWKNDRPCPFPVTDYGSTMSASQSGFPSTKFLDLTHLLSLIAQDSQTDAFWEMQ